MEDYIRKAFKSLEDFKVEIEPAVNPLKEAVEREEEKPDDSISIMELLKDKGSYVVEREFDFAGGMYSLFLEATCDGDSCDIEFEEFDPEHIDGILVEILDGEHNFIGSLSGEGITPETTLAEVIEKAGGLISGEEPAEGGAEPTEENERVFINDEDKAAEEEPHIDEGSCQKELNESEKFDVNSSEEMDKADELLHKDPEDTIEQIVDASAESKEDLKKSYVGSIILQCPTCKAMMYKDPDQLVKVEGEEELYNIEDECPHCGAKDGFEIVGQVASLEVEPESEPTPPMTEPEPEPEAEPLDIGEPERHEHEEEQSPNPDAELGESLEKDAELGESPKEEGAEEAKVEQEGEAEPEKAECPECDKKEGEEEHCDSRDEKEEEHEAEIAVESFDERVFDRLVTRYLKETYSNVDSYRTSKAGVSDAEGKVVMEGVIAFKSGKEKPTKFVFEAKEMTKAGLLKLVGVNETFSSKRAFTLTGSVNEGKLLSESLSYRYEAEGKKVRGKAEAFKKI